MAVIIKRPLSIALAGETKTGKSYIGAAFVKKYGGIICDFSRINQSGGMDKTTVKYNLSNDIRQEGDNTIIEVGEAYTAANKVGVAFDNYKLILNWQDFEKAVAYAKVLSEDILQKRVWIVIDDTTAMRWHKAIDVMGRMGHKSIAQKDWGIASAELKLMVSNLSRDFNLLMINQMMDEYHEYEVIGEDGKPTKEKQKSNIRVPAWIPNGLDYLVDGMVHIEIDKSVKPAKQYLVIDGGRECWICDSNFVERVDNITPELIMKVLGIGDERL